MKAYATLLPRDNRIAVDLRPAPQHEFEEEAHAEFAHLVSGASWRAKLGRWLYPATPDKCREMRQAWGNALRVHVDLSTWYKARLKAEGVSTSLAVAEDAELKVVPIHSPTLYADLAPDQRAAVAWGTNAYRGAGILAPKMGVGKTRTVAGILVERQVKGNVLIVCPKIAVKSVWQKELSKYVDWPIYCARGTWKNREKVIDAYIADPSPVKVLVIVAECLRIAAKLKNGRIVPGSFEGYWYPQLFNTLWDTIVVDESQKLLASTQVVKATLAGWGLKKLKQSDAPHALRLAVSATPFGKGGRAYGMFGTLHWCWPEEFKSFWQWAEATCHVEEKKVSKTQVVKKIGGLKDPEGEAGFFRSLGPRIFRRTLEEVSPAHRGMLTWHELACEMEPAQAKQYKAMSDNGEVATPGGVLSATGTLAEMTRARQLANGEVTMVEGKVKFTGVSGKLEMLMAELESFGTADGDGPKMVITSQFNEFLEVVCARLEKEGVAYHLLTGATSDKERDHLMATFQADGGPLVFVLNSRAGGVAITLDAADVMYQIDEMYPPEANEQLHARIFRRSRVHEVRIVYLRSMGTIDETVKANVMGKLRDQLAILDGRRGKAEVRKLLKYRPEAA